MCQYNVLLHISFERNALPLSERLIVTRGIRIVLV